ncbi:MAG TPA: WYL domain-containing protein [Actinomycetota bacterium]|nr:WYL domain-containing protein [Actinomycetota bacterium]
MAESTHDKFRRLIAMINLVQERGAIEVQELVDIFQVNKRQLMNDLDMIQMCGLPGYSPGDLIEVVLEGDLVSIRSADYFARPLNLAPSEAIMLFAGVQALAATGDADKNLRSAMEKLAGAMGEHVAGRLAVDVDQLEEVAVIRGAMHDHRRIHLIYQSGSKEEITERKVDPHRLFVWEGIWYVWAYCHRAQADRVFRVDRIRSLELLEEIYVPSQQDATRYSGIDFEGPPGQELTLEVSPESSWVIEKLRAKVVGETEDGWTSVSVDGADTVWMERMLLMLGPRVRNVEPVSVAERVRALAQKVLNSYA